jgi:hypothetical protein
VHSALRASAELILPWKVFVRIRAIRSRHHQIKYLNSIGVLEATERYIEQYGTIVRYGPFAGMVYPLEAALNRHVIPKLLGTYEMELHRILEKVAPRKYETIINIGAAEGYYAIGLARMLGTPVLAYEPEPKEAAYCQENARINRVPVEIRRFFTRNDIPAYSGKKVLVVCDCEGFEGQLFTRDTVELTSTWDMLIELHGSCATQLPQLPWSQEIAIIKSEPRVGRYPELGTPAASHKMLDEHRGERTTWLVLLN